MTLVHTRLPLVTTALLALAAAGAHADTIVLTPSQDNTLYAESGSTSNGAGQSVFTGPNGGGFERRALLLFDVAGSLPAGATITSAALTLTVLQTSTGASTVTVHELSTSWGEGTSDAPGNEGGGTAATTGDATWDFRFFNTTSWTTPGGDFDAAASASLVVDPLGAYTWGPTPALVDDVQGWLDAPATNDGWILLGTVGSKRYGSRQGGAADQPVLTIEFEPGSAFCNDTDGALAACPCANPGAADTGCDVAQGTGGVRLDVVDFAPDGLGGGTAALVGSGYPLTGTPTCVAMRGTSQEAVPVVFGDGVRCVASAGLLRVGAAFAIGGTSTRSIAHGAGPGTFHYQLWFRNTPAGFCTPDAFNVSSGYELAW